MINNEADECLEVVLHKKNKFGTDYLYPDNEKAELFAKLVKKLTLSYEDAQHISKLGFKVIIHSGKTEVIE